VNEQNGTAEQPPETLEVDGIVHKREVPPDSGLYLMRSGGQTPGAIAQLAWFVDDEGAHKAKVFTHGTAETPDAHKLVSLPLAPYYFGPRIEARDGKLELIEW